MDNYNGEYDQHTSIIITSDDHRTCTLVAGLIKHLCKAWYFNVQFWEHKSARKGDVLKREIQTRQIGYASDILAFSESLRAICFHYDLFLNVSIKITPGGTTRKDGRSDLIKNTFNTVVG